MDRKVLSSHMLVNKIAFGGVVTKSETAVAIAAAILLENQGAEELARQQPLKAEDEGDAWTVRGSYEDPSLAPGLGAWSVRILKDDAQVTKMGHRLMRLDAPEPVKVMARQEKARRKGQAG